MHASGCTASSDGRSSTQSSTAISDGKADAEGQMVECECCQKAGAAVCSGAEPCPLDKFEEVGRERFRLAAVEEGGRRQLALQAVHNARGPSTPMFAADGREIGYYDLEPDINKLFIKCWLPGAIFLVRTQSGGWPRSAEHRRPRYICVLNAQHRDTIGDLNARIVAHPDASGMLTAGDMHIFFRGKCLANEATLIPSSIDDDVIDNVHVCTQDNAGAVVAASQQLWSWHHLNKAWQGGASA